MIFDSDADVGPHIMVEYEKLLKKSYTENFEDLQKTDLLKVIGKDVYGSFIVLLVPCFIMAGGTDPEKTLRYAIYRLDSIVKEKYVLILCETHSNWLSDTVFLYAKQWYDVLPKVYKKNLKKLYLLHGGFFSKTFLTMMTPFISEKFWKKLEYIEKLEDLFIKLNINPANNLKHFPYIVQRNEELLLGVEPISFFGADLEILCQRFGRSFMGFKNIPSILVNFIDYLLKPEIINTKDLFNLQTDSATLYEIVGDIENGEPTTDFNNIPALVCSFRLFLDVQKWGLLGKDACASLLQIRNSSSTKIIKYTLAKLFDRLQLGTQQCVLCLLNFFQKVVTHSEQNNMTAKTLSIIFAPSFFRSRKPLINYQECIPLANKCLLMLIQDPTILENYETKDNSGSDISSVSSEENKSPSSGKLRVGREKEDSSGSSNSSSNSSSTDSNSETSEESEEDSDDSEDIINNTSKNSTRHKATKDLKKSGTIRLNSKHNDDIDISNNKSEVVSNLQEKNINRRLSTAATTNINDNTSSEEYKKENNGNNSTTKANSASTSKEGKEVIKTKSLSTVSRMISKAFTSMKSNLKNSSNNKLDMPKRDSDSTIFSNDKKSGNEKETSDINKDPLKQSHTMIKNNNIIYSKVISRKLTEKKDIDTDTESESGYDLASSTSDSSVPTKQNRSVSNQDGRRESGKKENDKFRSVLIGKVRSASSSQNMKSMQKKRNDSKKTNKGPLKKKISKGTTDSSDNNDSENNSSGSDSGDSDSSESISGSSDGTSSYDESSDSSDQKK